MNIHRLSQIKKFTLRQKLSNQATAQLRARLTKLLADNSLYFDIVNLHAKTTKFNQRRERFRNYDTS